jgi:hypothetical protein
MARIAAANSLLDRGWGKPPVSLELREPEPQHIIELIEDAEHLTQELFAVPLAITDADGTSNKDAPNIRDSPVTLGRKGGRSRSVRVTGHMPAFDPYRKFGGKIRDVRQRPTTGRFPRQNREP